MLKFQTFEERFDYLKLSGKVGETTFGYDRYLNQMLYNSQKWRRLRREIIIRDDGCDLALEGYVIPDKIIIHHINPITIPDVENDELWVYDPEFLVCVSTETHNAIHYGDEDAFPRPIIERYPGDTKLW